jgi:hypothetical protein
MSRVYQSHFFAKKSNAVKSVFRKKAFAYNASIGVFCGMKLFRVRTSAKWSIFGVALGLANCTAFKSFSQTLARSRATRTYCNTVRVDIGGPIVLNLVVAGSNQAYKTVLPVLLGYERHLTPHLTANVEGIVNGGFRYEKTAGLSIQGRYYMLQLEPGQALGFYLAPVLAYRAIRQTIGYNATELVVHSQLAGVGGLIGMQAPLGGRLVVDVALGYMGWKHLHDDKTVNTDVRTYRELDAATVDGRLSLGYRF